MNNPNIDDDIQELKELEKELLNSIDLSITAAEKALANGEAPVEDTKVENPPKDKALANGEALVEDTKVEKAPVEDTKVENQPKDKALGNGEALVEDTKVENPPKDKFLDKFDHDGMDALLAKYSSQLDAIPVSSFVTAHCYNDSKNDVDDGTVHIQPIANIVTPQSKPHSFKRTVNEIIDAGTDTDSGTKRYKLLIEIQDESNE
jgi:hypothetical protein